MTENKTNCMRVMTQLLGTIIFIVVFPCLVSSNEIKSVLIISIDALHPAALGSKTTKNIHNLMKQGVFTLDGKSTDPPLTLLSHAAMFSGIGPQKGGRKDNKWYSGQPVINDKTIFDDAKSNGYSTGFFYSKEKLGYLVTDGVDRYNQNPDFAIENAMDFFQNPDKKRFCFLHISGLDRTGPVEGWMSQGYMEELFFIDEAIDPLINIITSKKNYLIIITSDHAGHDTIHGSDHPDDAKLPLVMISDVVDLEQYQGIKYHVTQLRFILKSFL
ncbi:MAG: alkaline phosphatase family protein [Deltaproteobacteria bacterium]|nr:alkaline phosphatase family protein [Deltaproteobacteria bacterium]